MRVRFKAYQIPSGRKGRIILEMAAMRPDEQDAERQQEWRAIGNFLRKKAEKERQSGLEKALWVEFETYFKKASWSQWKLLMGILHRIAEHDTVDYKKIYAGVRLSPYWPEELDADGNSIKKIGEDLTTKELSKIIEGVVAEQMERVDGPDFSDFYVLWADWRHNKQEQDPLSGEYSGAEDYRDKHPYCEICGKGLRTAEAPDGSMQHEGQRMHIVPGVESDDAWLMGCTHCHMLIQHQKGWNELIAMYPHIAGKVRKALEKYGTKIVSQDGEQGQLFDENHNDIIKEYEE